VADERRQAEVTEAASEDSGAAPAAAGSPKAAEVSEDTEGVQQVERDFGELLSDVERERDEYLELARRTKADFENYRRRVTSEAVAAEKRGRADLARQLLPVVDNLERALLAADSPPAGADERPEQSLAEGVRLVLSELHAVLERAGIESYEPAGETFDPEWHEAMMTRPAPPGESGKVLQVLEKGYRLDGQVLRPARVVVGAAEQPAGGSRDDHPSADPSAGPPAVGGDS
jgi:molecular chaperone GrpE